jgi:hypothetical protein
MNLSKDERQELVRKIAEIETSDDEDGRDEAYVEWAKTKLSNDLDSNMDDEADIPKHPNCRCELEGGKWIALADACNICEDAQEMWNRAYLSGNIQEAENIWKAHKSLS